ncbi:MAG: hypothetical protein L6Q71_00630 [Planctomycetes bacterium]|nr:hypothetical protein [Planctomycetota bacterium]NUQ35642.1 hypothetical protein [Planctomycetaceae bacterium]
MTLGTCFASILLDSGLRTPHSGLLTVTDDPFTAYRVLVSAALAGIWIYTLIDAIIFLRVTIGREKQSLPGMSADLSRSVRINRKLLRVGQKLAVVKVIETLSWRSLLGMWKELALILALTVANAVALYFFYVI